MLHLGAIWRLAFGSSPLFRAWSSGAEANLQLYTITADLCGTRVSSDPRAFRGTCGRLGGDLRDPKIWRRGSLRGKGRLVKCQPFWIRPLPWMEGIGAAPVARLLRLRSDLLVCLGESGFKIARSWESSCPIVLGFMPFTFLSLQVQALGVCHRLSFASSPKPSYKKYLQTETKPHTNKRCREGGT